MEHQKDTQKDITPVYVASNDFYDHARKIVTAIYLLTDLLKDNEPIKWTLRTKVLDLVSFTGVLSRSSGPSINGGDEKDIIEQVNALVSLLDIGVLSGLVSPMNHEILTRELKVFRDNAVRHFHATEGNQSLFTSSLFTGFDFKEQPHISQGHIKRTISPSKGQMKITVRTEKNVLNKNVHQKDINNGQQNERKEKIVQLIRSRGSVMIKDISPEFPGLSEKTIQRDLLDLVSRGSVRKSGERRWTIYSVAK
ncbi:MAG: hypothetical protein AMXMBFR44_6770 [Candidatus Campbellbacteria bacterium]